MQGIKRIRSRFQNVNRNNRQLLSTIKSKEIGYGMFLRMLGKKEAANMLIVMPGREELDFLDSVCCE